MSAGGAPFMVDYPGLADKRACALLTNSAAAAIALSSLMGSMGGWDIHLPRAFTPLQERDVVFSSTKHTSLRTSLLWLPDSDVMSVRHFTFVHASSSDLVSSPPIPFAR